MTSAKAAKLRIAFLGDSITVGDGDAAARGWPSRLMALTSPTDGQTQCYNLGVGGDRIADVKARCASELAARLTGKEGTGVVVMIGINDALRAAAKDNCIPLDKAKIATDFAFILQTAKQYGPVIVVEPAPVLPDLKRGDGGMGSQIMSRLAEILIITDAVCAAHNTPIVHTLNKLIEDTSFIDSLGAGDGLHPTAKGYDRLADVVLLNELWAQFLDQCRSL